VEFVWVLPNTSFKLMNGRQLLMEKHNEELYNTSYELKKFMQDHDRNFTSNLLLDSCKDLDGSCLFFLFRTILT